MEGARLKLVGVTTCEDMLPPAARVEQARQCRAGPSRSAPAAEGADVLVLVRGGGTALQVQGLTGLARHSTR